MQNLLEYFANPRLDLRPSSIGNLDVIGNSYEYLIARFASGVGKKAGEFYTPPEVSELLAALLDPQLRERIFHRFHRGILPKSKVYGELGDVGPTPPCGREVLKRAPQAPLRAPTDSTSLRSSFLGNSPTGSPAT